MILGTIKDAITAKVKANPIIQIHLIASHLPFVHYYIMYDYTVLEIHNEDWIIEYWESLRREYKNLY